MEVSLTQKAEGDQGGTGLVEGSHVTSGHPTAAR